MFQFYLALWQIWIKPQVAPTCRVNFDEVTFSVGRTQHWCYHGQSRGSSQCKSSCFRYCFGSFLHVTDKNKLTPLPGFSETQAWFWAVSSRACRQAGMSSFMAAMFRRFFFLVKCLLPEEAGRLGFGKCTILFSNASLNRVNHTGIGVSKSQWPLYSKHIPKFI